MCNRLPYLEDELAVPLLRYANPSVRTRSIQPFMMAGTVNQYMGNWDRKWQTLVNLEWVHFNHQPKSKAFIVRAEGSTLLIGQSHIFLIQLTVLLESLPRI